MMLRRAIAAVGLARRATCQVAIGLASVERALVTIRDELDDRRIDVAMSEAWRDAEAFRASRISGAA